MIGVAKRPSKLAFTLGRFAGFLKLLFRNGKSLAGLTIIAIFCVLAVVPQWFTPFNNLGQDITERGFPLAGGSTAPVWLRYIPAWLGGKPTLSENMYVFQNPGYPKLRRDDGELNFTIDGSGIVINESDANYPYVQPRGFLKFAEPGSLNVTFSREEGILYNESRVIIFKEFDFPYLGVPSRFYGNIELLVKGTVDVKGELDAPVKVTVFLGPVGGRMWRLWPPPNNPIEDSRVPRGFTRDLVTGQPGPIVKPEYGALVWDNASYTWVDRGWITSVSTDISVIDSESNSVVNAKTDFGRPPNRPVPMVFTSVPGKYIYGVEMIFSDRKNSSKPVSTSVFIDDFGLILFGTSFGFMGTDHHGQDLFAQLIYGTRISIYLGVMVAVLSVTIGLAIGLTAGYMGRVVDELLMRFTDILLMLPGLPLLVVLVAVLGATIDNLIILLGLLGWMGFARMVRSQVLSLKERPFVEAAKAVGAGRFHIIVSHVVPSVMPLIYISLAMAVPGAVTAEAALSWLGFYDPFRMSWGRMLNAFFEANATTNWWWVVPPGACIAALAAAFVLLGYALDEVLNPKLRQRR